MYNVNKFIINNFENNSIIQNSNGISIIESKKLISFLNYIDSNYINYFDDSLLLKFFKLKELDEVLEFLLNNEIIYFKRTLNNNIEKIKIFTNNNVLKELFIFLNSNKFELIENVDSLTLSNNDLLIIFLNPLLIYEYNGIFDSLYKKNFNICMSFVYDSKIYISNVFKNDWCNPCPKCFISNIESTLRAFGEIQQSPSFQTIIDIIYSQNLIFEINTPLEKLDLLYLVSEFNKMLNLDINILSKRIVEITLDGKITYDVATHWELCDCFEKR